MEFYEKSNKMLTKLGLSGGREGGEPQEQSVVVHQFIPASKSVLVEHSLPSVLVVDYTNNVLGIIGDALALARVDEEDGSRENLCDGEVGVHGGN